MHQNKRYQKFSGEGLSPNFTPVEMGTPHFTAHSVVAFGYLTSAPSDDSHTVYVQIRHF